MGRQLDGSCDGNGGVEPAGARLELHVCRKHYLASKRIDLQRISGVRVIALGSDQSHVNRLLAADEMMRF